MNLRDGTKRYRAGVAPPEQMVGYVPFAAAGSSSAAALRSYGIGFSYRSRTRTSSGSSFGAWGGWSAWSALLSLPHTGATDRITGGGTDYEFRVHYMLGRYSRINYQVLTADNPPPGLYTARTAYAEFRSKYGLAKSRQVALSGSRWARSTSYPSYYNILGAILGSADTTLRVNFSLTGTDAQYPAPSTTPQDVAFVGGVVQCRWLYYNLPQPTDSAGRYWLRYTDLVTGDSGGVWVLPVFDTTRQSPYSAAPLIATRLIPESPIPAAVSSGGGSLFLDDTEATLIAFSVQLVTVGANQGYPISVVGDDSDPTFFSNVLLTSQSRTQSSMGDARGGSQQFPLCRVIPDGVSDTNHWLDLPQIEPPGYRWHDPNTWPVSDVWTIPVPSTPDTAVSRLSGGLFCYTPAEVAGGVEPWRVSVTP